MTKYGHALNYSVYNGIKLEKELVEPAKKSRLLRDAMNGRAGVSLFDKEKTAEKSLLTAGVAIRLRQRRLLSYLSLEQNVNWRHWQHWDGEKHCSP